MADEESSLLLAAEECPRDQFEDYHAFTGYERGIVSRLVAHGPVLLRGGRGSGKSALLLEAYFTAVREHPETILPVYLSLRHLPLLTSQGDDYLSYFCKILSKEIATEVIRVGGGFFPAVTDVGGLLESLERIASQLSRRILLLFDDAAHIGRERPLEEFFDIFRTISTSRVSCKASIYPGVTRFGVRFDVFNDSTVIDISRDERKMGFEDIFIEVTKKRFPGLVGKIERSRSMNERLFARVMGRAVTGNLRSFIFACNTLVDSPTIGYPELTRSLLDLSGNYFWPLLDEVAPKLGSYEVLVRPAQQIAELVFNACAKKGVSYFLVHRELVQRYSKLFEILEYAGFISRRDASRALKSGGRGVVYAVNLCNLLDVTSGRRLTAELAAAWTQGTEDPFEVHVSNPELAKIEVPEPEPGKQMSVLAKPVRSLMRSNAYPYGLTEDKVERLEGAGIGSVLDVASAGDGTLLSIPMIGPKHLKRIRDVVFQAIWM